MWEWDTRLRKTFLLFSRWDDKTGELVALLDKTVKEYYLTEKDIKFRYMTSMGKPVFARDFKPTIGTTYYVMVEEFPDYAVAYAVRCRRCNKILTYSDLSEEVLKDEEKCWTCYHTPKVLTLNCKKCLSEGQLTLLYNIPQDENSIIFSDFGKSFLLNILYNRIKMYISGCFHIILYAIKTIKEEVSDQLANNIECIFKRSREIPEIKRLSELFEAHKTELEIEVTPYREPFDK